MYEYFLEEGSTGPLFYFTNHDQNTFEIGLESYPTGVTEYGKALSISVQCLQTDTPKKDSRVGETIIGILSEYLDGEKDSILVYICDSYDKRAEQRQRKFSSWYSLYAAEKYVLRKFEVDAGDCIYYSAMVFDPSVYDEDELVNQYEMELAAMQEYK